MKMKLLFALLMALGLQVSHASELDPAYVKLFKMQVAMAQTGKPLDLYNLGRMYEQGLGTDQDLDKAHELYTKAATKGEPRAKHKIEVWEEAEKALAEQLGDTEPETAPAQVSKAAPSVKKAAPARKRAPKQISAEARKRAAWKRAMAAALKQAEDSDIGW